MTLYRRDWFNSPAELVEFLNDKKIQKDNIVSVLMDTSNEICLIWKEVESDASDD